VDLARRARFLSVVGHSVAGMGVRHTSAAYRELGGMLRRVREKSGLSGEALARMLGWSPSVVSRMEIGKRPSTTTDVIQYAVMCGARREVVQPIVEFTRMAEHQEGYYLSDRLIEGSFESLLFHESLAEHSVMYEPQVINGLMQTPEYARAMVAAFKHDPESDRVTGAVRTRMERQRVLSLPKPARFTFFVHEQALRLRVGSDQIMHEQLLKLVLIAAMHHVTLRVVPSMAGERSANGGSFRLMEFNDHRPMVHLDNLWGGGLIVDDSSYVRGYQRELMPRLEEVALGERQSRAFVAAMADDFDRRTQQGGTDVRSRQWVGNGLRQNGEEPATSIYH
jgi:transcriptional regulator with XRE-family HTH domain